jgi:hypothetical protein
MTVGVISLTNFRTRASTKTCSELCRTRHQFITGNRDGYFVSFVLVVAHTYIVHVVGAGSTTLILSPRPETTTWHRVLDLVKLEKRVPGNHDSPHRWWPTNAPRKFNTLVDRRHLLFELALTYLLALGTLNEAKVI